MTNALVRLRRVIEYLESEIPEMRGAWDSLYSQLVQDQQTAEAQARLNAETIRRQQLEYGEHIRLLEWRLALLRLRYQRLKDSVQAQER